MEFIYPSAAMEVQEKQQVKSDKEITRAAEAYAFLFRLEENVELTPRTVCTISSKSHWMQWDLLLRKHQYSIIVTYVRL